MKIVITGSLGHIGTHLLPLLNQEQQELTVLSSSRKRQQEIEALGATAKIGSLEDLEFLKEAFHGADLAYCMIPPNNYFDQELDLWNYYERVAHNFAAAIQHAQIKQVIYLSSIGAHLEEGNGILKGHYEGEKIMNALPNNVHIRILRPVEIYYNLYGQINSIKNQQVMASVCGGEVINAWVSTKDIAAVIAQEIKSGIHNRSVRYIASEEISYNNLAKSFGKELELPDLSWVQISSSQLSEGLKSIGMNPNIADGLVEMYEAIDSGLLYENYHKNKPETYGRIKVADFAKEFAAAYKA